jgi:DNA-binding transcriptional LysR family regulator
LAGEEGAATFTLHAKLEHRVRDPRENRAGHLAIIGTPPRGYGIIPPALKRCLLRRPKTRVFFDVRRDEGVIDGVLSGLAEPGFALGLSHEAGTADEILYAGEMVCVLSPKPAIAATHLAGLPLIGLERGTFSRCVDTRRSTLAASRILRHLRGKNDQPNAQPGA